MNAPNTRPILVTGGTGTLGKLVVAALQAQGYRLRVLSRRAHPSRDGVEYVSGDLDKGRDIDAAVAGTKIVVHCAGSSKGDDTKARNLGEAAATAGVQHLIHISVVGVDEVPQDTALDRMMFGYFGAKLAAEQAVMESGVPWTILRATQFHDLIAMVSRQMAKMPVIPVPSGFRFQPIEAGEVAGRLVQLALGPPAGRVPDLGGPRAYEMYDLVRSYLQATGRHRAILPIRLPGGAARAFRDGANLAPDRAVGRRTWEEFLEALVSPAASFAAKQVPSSTYQ